jgi:hypothetical protein
VTAAPAVRPAFAHASEAELARILDFYQVRWTYEPDIFPIGWSMTGEVVESFSPDFYLPDLDLYVELTTLKQKLVRKKNRKLRRLRELYPDIRIKLFYARDFRALLLKFGRLALLDDLTGTTGQATPPRTADRILSEAGAAAGFERPGFPVAPDGIHDPGARPDALAEDAGHESVAEETGAEGADSPSALPAVPPAPRAAPVGQSSPPRGRRRGRRRRRDGASPVDTLMGSTAAQLDPEQSE